MKENFSEKADKFLRDVMDIPPTLEEVEANFPHGAECSRIQPLRQVEKEERVFIPGSGWAGLPTVRVIRKYLECDECHVQAMFNE